jgi:quercetin dioxygenase-like cupin family protein
MAELGRCFCLISVLVPLLWATSVPAGAADNQGGVSAKVLKKTTLTGNGQKIIYPATDKAEVTAMLVDVAPGAETGWHSHPHPGICLCGGRHSRC